MLTNERILEILEYLPRLPPVGDQMRLLMQTTLLAQGEPNVVEISPPLAIIGDVHGQFEDLLYCVYKSLGQPRILQLGDFVDRGPMSLECLLLLCCLKALNPHRLVVLRGNHEEDAYARLYGFYDEIQRKSATRVYAAAMRLFEALPVAAVSRVEALGDLDCAQAACSEDFSSLASGRAADADCSLQSGWVLPTTWMNGGTHDRDEPAQKPAAEYQNAEPFNATTVQSAFFTHGGISRYFMMLKAIQETSRFSTALNALLWPDPDPNIQLFGPSQRGNGENFGIAAAREFCRENDVELIIRAHYYQDLGFSLFDHTVATVWSAANYCGRCYNLGAFAVFDYYGALLVYRFKSYRRSCTEDKYWQVDYFL